METVTGIFAITLALIFNYFFFRLGKDFEYPDILKQPSGRILQKFQSNNKSIRRSWYGFMLGAVLFAPLIVMIHYTYQATSHIEILGLATACGLISAVYQTLGLSRWVFTVPYLADLHKSSKSESQKETIETIFMSQHKYLGEGIGEHLGYLFTSLWTILLATFLLLTEQLNFSLGIGGIIAGVAIAIGTLEFFGQKWAGGVNAVGYILWSVWVICLGLALILN